MGERFLTTFYPKIKNNSVEQKKASLSILNITQKTNSNSKLDYSSILSQIKTKSRQKENSSLYHNFLYNNFTNMKQKQKYLRFKFISQNQQSQIALFTEPNYNKKNFSSKKIDNETKHILRKNLYSPKKLINQIIKFEEEKKVIRKIKLNKKSQTIELSNSYKQYIEKIKRYNFFNKYQNCNTDYSHYIKANFFIDKVNENIKQEKIANDKYLKKEKEKMEEEKESRDKVFYPPLDMQKISSKIKSILSRFNEIDKRERFFDKFENRVNFLFDNFKPPSIKNNLTKIKYEDAKNEKKIKLVNRVGNATINYLSNAKVKFQRLRDEKIKFLIEKNKIKTKYGYYKKLASFSIYNSKEQIEKIIYKNYYVPNEEDFLVNEEEPLTLDEIFEKQNYFANKYEKFEKVCIAEPKLRKFYFDCINFEKKKGKQELQF